MLRNSYAAAFSCAVNSTCACAARMSDEPSRLSNVSDLLRQSNQEDEEERVIAKLHASASLERAKNKGLLLQALIAEAARPLRSLQTPPLDAGLPREAHVLTTQDIDNHVESLDLTNWGRTIEETPRRVSNKRKGAPASASEESDSSLHPSCWPFLISFFCLKSYKISILLFFLDACSGAQNQCNSVPRRIASKRARPSHAFVTGRS